MRYTVKRRYEECPQAPTDSAYVYTVLTERDEVIREFLDADSALDLASELNRRFPA